ncbi:hypothetical protein [Kribbella sp. NPDC051137]|uniref:hypothetical protein n=1 Tax=Kribbella sp. NPDC051137 TaxID=3155045 RepID=UPI0034441A7D
MSRLSLPNSFTTSGRVFSPVTASNPAHSACMGAVVAAATILPSPTHALPASFQVGMSQPSVSFMKSRSPGIDPSAGSTGTNVRMLCTVSPTTVSTPMTTFCGNSRQSCHHGLSRSSSVPHAGGSGSLSESCFGGAGSPSRCPVFGSQALPPYSFAIAFAALIAIAGNSSCMIFVTSLTMRLLSSIIAWSFCHSGLPFFRRCQSYASVRMFFSWVSFSCVAPARLRRWFATCGSVGPNSLSFVSTICIELTSLYFSGAW